MDGGEAAGQKVFMVSYVMSEEHVLLFYVVLLEELFRNYMAVDWSFWRVVPRTMQRAILKNRKQIQKSLPFHTFGASVLRYPHNFDEFASTWHIRMRGFRERYVR